MKKILNILFLLAPLFLFTQCNNYLETSSASNASDEFVTTTTTETFKTLSWCYANYRQNCIMGVYRYNDVFASDAEHYPEANSTNNVNAKMRPQDLTVDAASTGFNNLYSTLARASKIAEIIKGKAEYQKDLAGGVATDWTQLYGEAITLRDMCYFDLVKHFGDVPYGYENANVNDYSLNSRFDIYDNLIASLKDVAPMMYKIGEGGITAERMSQSFCYALMGEIALYSGGYQTIRTDVDGLYGSLQFTKISNEENGCVYARRTDYMDYYKLAETYLQKAIDNAGTARLITSDNRSYTNNPFQLNFQYFENLQVSPESFLEIGNMQGGQNGTGTNSEYPYAFGRPSKGGGLNAAPCKSFGCLRIIPTVYYGEFQKGDMRRDVSVTVTGSNGDGNEVMLSFVPGSKTVGGIAINKWDENRMSPPYTARQRQSGINWPVLRMADVMLMLAEAKAVVGDDDNGAINLVNQIRERAFGNSNHDISGLSGNALLNAVLEERKLELLGEGTRRWDLIRNGLMSKRAVEVRNEMKTMINDIKTQGYHTFSNGNTISAYIFTKMDSLGNPLTYECTDSTNGALYPGWRGQYNYLKTTVASKVKGTKHNVDIKGLFKYIDPAGTVAATLESEGYQKTNWGIDLVDNESTYMDNILSGVTDENQPPRYYWPIPSETISGSKGRVTNGYGLPQQ